MVSLWLQDVLAVLDVFLETSFFLSSQDYTVFFLDFNLLSFLAALCVFSLLSVLFPGPNAFLFLGLVEHVHQLRRKLKKWCSAWGSWGGSVD